MYVGLLFLCGKLDNYCLAIQEKSEDNLEGRGFNESVASRTLAFLLLTP